MDKVRAGGMVQTSGLALVGVMAIPDRPGVAGAILSTLGGTGLNVQYLVELFDLDGTAHVAFCVSQGDLTTTLAVMEEVKDTIGAQEITHRKDVAIVSVFGPDFRQRAGIAGTMFDALASLGVDILSISTSISTVSCVIDNDDMHVAAEAIREAFDLP